MICCIYKRPIFCEVISLQGLIGLSLLVFMIVLEVQYDWSVTVGFQESVRSPI